MFELEFSSNQSGLPEMQSEVYNAIRPEQKQIRKHRDDKTQNSLTSSSAEYF